MKIYRECTKKPFSFLTIDTTLPAGNPLRFRKKTCFTLIKLTVNDLIKILDDKIKSNQVQYDLRSEAAKMSALSSKNILDKYEYLTGEDLGCTPNLFEKAKFEFSPLGMSLRKAFKKDEVKSVAKSKSDFNYDSNHTFCKFYKGYDEFIEMSLDSKYNRMKEFNKLLIIFKRVKTEKKKKHNSKRSEL